MGDAASRKLHDPSLRIVFACAWPALFVAVLSLLPFLNKPYLVDDPHFLNMARQIVQHPSHPMDYETCWNVPRVPCVKAYTLTPGNVLLGYVLVPTVLAGSKEWMAHATQLPLVCVALLGMAAFLLRLGYSRFEATTGSLLFAAIPPFLPMASTAMPDSLAAAIAILAMERLAAWKTSPAWSRGLAAALALGLAGIARAHLALLVPLAALFLFDTIEPRAMLAQLRREWQRWIPVFLGGCLLAAIILITRERSLALDPPASFRSIHNISRNLRAYLTYLCFPIPFVAFWAASRFKRHPIRILLLVLAGGAWAAISGDLSHFCILPTAAALADLVLTAWRKRDHRRLFLAAWILLPLPVVYYGHFPIKYLLPCIPAVIVLGFGWCADMPRIFRPLTAALIASGVVYSLLILRADFEMANFGRTSIEALVRPHTAAGETVWYGSEYGPYWYAPAAGARLLRNADQPRPGDLLVVGMLEGGELVLERFPHVTLVQRITHNYSFGRTLGLGAGLYTNLAGPWLFDFGKSEYWDRFDLVRIQ